MMLILAIYVLTGLLYTVIWDVGKMGNISTGATNTYWGDHAASVPVDSTVDNTQRGWEVIGYMNDSVSLTDDNTQRGWEVLSEYQEHHMVGAGALAWCAGESVAIGYDAVAYGINEGVRPSPPVDVEASAQVD